MTSVLKLFRTTTFRLSLIYMVLFGAAAALAIGYIYWNTSILFTHQLRQTIDAEIQGLREQFLDGGVNVLAETVANRSVAPGNSLYLLAAANGTPIAGNLKVRPETLKQIGEPFEISYTAFDKKETVQRRAIIRVLQFRSGFYLVVGRDIEDKHKFERVIGSAFLWGLGVIALVGLGGGWLVSRSILARIDGVTAASRKIMRGDLSGRVPVYGTSDELDRLAENLNAMLERIEQLMIGLREVSDNIAHDLKTPLNRLRNRAEAALRAGQGETSYREALERTIDEADELIRTFNALLSIARLEAGALRETMSDVDVSALARDVAELYEPAAEDRGLQLKSEIAEGLHLTGERQLLGQAVANLVDNAIKYGAPAGKRRSSKENTSTITLTGARRNGLIEIAVSDPGAGIPPKDRSRVFNRFVRLEESRSHPGSGLGLSLVAAVARLHGGSVRLEDNKPGLKAVLSLPVRERDGGRLPRDTTPRG